MYNEIIQLFSYFQDSSTSILLPPLQKSSSTGATPFRWDRPRESFLPNRAEFWVVSRPPWRRGGYRWISYPSVSSRYWYQPCWVFPPNSIVVSVWPLRDRLSWRSWRFLNMLDVCFPWRSDSLRDYSRFSCKLYFFLLQRSFFLDYNCF